MEKCKKIVLIGNGFDLAHGLKTSYPDFINWYICDHYTRACNLVNARIGYSDPLVEIGSKQYNVYNLQHDKNIKTFQDVIKLFTNHHSHYLSYPSEFFESLVNILSVQNWVDIEYQYFKLLGKYFSKFNTDPDNSREDVKKLNAQFNFLIEKLTEYITMTNEKIDEVKKLRLSLHDNFYKNFNRGSSNTELIFVNFNYTETLISKGYADEEQVIHIHGRAKTTTENPIIFGYGDETNPIYQAIEDSGENIFLEHIKSFGYFRTDNYKKILRFINSDAFTVSVIGHSCGLSDRILLHEIFEHPNCKGIDIFYYRKSDGTDNFKEITQEISRHFKNKALMRAIVQDQNDNNVIPQNSIL